MFCVEEAACCINTLGGDCSTIIACIGACSGADLACKQACFEAGDSLAQYLYSVAQDCAASAGCYAQADPTGCAAASCLTDFAACTADVGRCQQSEIYGACDLLATDACCDDDSGAPMLCTGASSPYCTRSCVSFADCWWSNSCGVLEPGVCYFDVCDFAAGGFPGTIDEPCTQVQGQPGWCYAGFDRIDPFDQAIGMCIGAGTLAHGATCQTDTDEFYVDRSYDHCNNGLCLSGQCQQFCNASEIYQLVSYRLGVVQLPCPTDTNCMSKASIDPATGLWQPGPRHLRRRNRRQRCRDLLADHEPPDEQPVRYQRHLR